MTSYETVIGLEVHCQLATASKLFSAAPAVFGGEPNTRVTPVDLGLPGVLPVLNEHAVELAVRAALALGGTINPTTVFDRKNYFYPDLPKGYQISQYDKPYCSGGRVPLGDGRYGVLERIHLEEDAGKSTHTDQGSLVDLNRSGVALVEIVGRPDLRSAEDAHAFLVHLQRILRYAEVSDCDMEKGSLRCDANVSLRPAGSTRLGSKVEIKNLNSFKMVQRALEYEVRRQTAVLAAGGSVPQETRLWSEERGETASLRNKESAPDYRYFPDPDLPVLHIPAELVARLRAEIPELPEARRLRWQSQYALPEHDVEVLLADRGVADYFEAVARASEAKAASNWTMTEVLHALHQTGASIAEFPLPPERLAELIRAIRAGTVNHPAGKKVFLHLLQHGGTVEAAIERLGLRQISDEAELEPILRRIVGDNPNAVADFRAGKEKALHALKGLAMRETRGKADPSAVDAILRRLCD